MKIGELATATGTPVQTIRFYERELLMPATPRTSGNYRTYGSTHAERLHFIRHCRSLDMALDEIRVLLRVKDAPETSCTEVNEVLDAHIEHVARRMRQLRALDRQLKQLRGRCPEAHAARDCGILKGLSNHVSRAPKPTLHVHGSHP